MEFLKERSGSGTVRLEGELNIQDAGQLKEMFVKAFAETESLLLNLNEVTGIDIACLQVLCSAHKTFLASNKELKTIGPTTASFERAVDESGYRRKAGCHPDPSRNCLWVMEERHE